MDEFKIMSDGLKIALKHAYVAGDILKVRVIQGMYAESLVAEKLLEKGYTFKFHRRPDLLVCGAYGVEVKCGKLFRHHASAKFGTGKQIREKEFSHCVWVIIDKDSLEPVKRFVFTVDELKECATPRPRMTGKYKNIPCILFFYKNFEDLVKESEKAGEPIFDIEKKLHYHPKEFEERWDKIPCKAT